MYTLECYTACDAGYVCCKLNSSYLEKQEVKASNPLLWKARASCLKTVQLLAGKHRALSSSIWLFHKAVQYKFKLYVKAQFNSKFCLLDCELRQMVGSVPEVLCTHVVQRYTHLHITLPFSLHFCCFLLPTQSVSCSHGFHSFCSSEFH